MAAQWGRQDVFHHHWITILAPTEQGCPLTPRPVWWGHWRRYVAYDDRRICGRLGREYRCRRTCAVQTWWPQDAVKRRYEGRGHQIAYRLQNKESHAENYRCLVQQPRWDGRARLEFVHLISPPPVFDSRPVCPMPSGLRLGLRRW